ncbi:MAG: hypothetical protein U9N50_05390 [Pseudomonadota bacterium]|nr:hypothetical protein [Pseudomonadota bacterium]
MVITDTSKKYLYKTITKKRMTENNEAISTEQEKQPIREQFATIDDTNLVNTFFVLS